MEEDQVSSISGTYTYENKALINQIKTPTKTTYHNVDIFIKKTFDMLKEQQQSEIQLFRQMTEKKSIMEIQNQGAALSNMLVISSKAGYYGKQIITLVKAYSSEKNPINLPEDCKISVGDDVGIFQKNVMIASGVVNKRLSTKIKISIRNNEEDEIDYEGKNVNIVLKWNEVTYKRYFSILKTMESEHNHPLIQLFFNGKNQGLRKTVEYQNPNLNKQQCIAISHGLIDQGHLVHGPPGTGKTRTICQLIFEAVKKGQKVLACGPSNISVDNIVEGIYKRVNCVRIGNPARMTNEVVERSLDFLVSKATNKWKTQDKKLQNLKKKVAVLRNKNQGKFQLKKLYKEMRQIKTEINSMSEQVIEEILIDADAICCTNTGAGDSLFNKIFNKINKRKFDLVVIDECGQGLQVGCWIPMLRGRRVVLAGDHKQLPPTIKCKQDSLLSYTLFTRAMQELTYIPSTMLKVQYRMNQAIMGWSNKMFYNGELQAHQSVKSHVLRQLCERVEQSQEILLMVDTTGCLMGEQGQENESKMNKGEADIVISLLKKLIAYEVNVKHIAILTPYSKQVSLIKTLLANHQLPMPQVSTVDGIQGRQKQCVIISMVRSNPQKKVGFLKDWRRMNVAVTRARRMLIIIGDGQCVSSDPTLESLVKWIDENGHRKSAMQLKDEPDIRFGEGKITEEIKTTINKQKSKKQKEKKGKQVNKQVNKQRNKNGQKVEIENTQNYFKHQESQQQDLKDKYKIQLMALEKRIIYVDLSSYQRKMLHQVAEQLGLGHQTSANKKKITIWIKNKNNQPQKQELLENQQDLEQNLIENQIPSQEAKQSQFKKQKKQLLKGRVMFENNQDQDSDQPQNKKEQIQEQKIQEKPKETQIKIGKKNKKKQKIKAQKPKQEQDWQAILKQFDEDCPKKDECYKCKKKITSVTASQCKFCKRSFCRFDLLAQEHGCDQQARNQARTRDINTHLKDGAEKIKQKIKEQQEQRNKKPKQKK